MKKRLTCIRTERNKVPAEIMCLDRKVMQNLDAKLDELYEPVAYDEEQILMIMDGSMYYDIEYEDSEWIRIFLERGDLIIVPKGTSHRCTTTPMVKISTVCHVLSVLILGLRQGSTLQFT